MSKRLGQFLSNSFHDAPGGPSVPSLPGINAYLSRQNLASLATALATQEDLDRRDEKKPSLLKEMLAKRDQECQAKLKKNPSICYDLEKLEEEPGLECASHCPRHLRLLRHVYHMHKNTKQYGIRISHFYKPTSDSKAIQNDLQLRKETLDQLDYAESFVTGKEQSDAQKMQNMIGRAAEEVERFSVDALKRTLEPVILPFRSDNVSIFDNDLEDDILTAPGSGMLDRKKTRPLRKDPPLILINAVFSPQDTRDWILHVSRKCLWKNNRLQVVRQLKDGSWKPVSILNGKSVKTQLNCNYFIAPKATVDTSRYVPYQPSYNPDAVCDIFSSAVLMIDVANKEPIVETPASGYQEGWDAEDGRLIDLEVDPIFGEPIVSDIDEEE